MFLKDIILYLFNPNQAIQYVYSLCPISFAPFYIKAYYMKWVKTSWTMDMQFASFITKTSLHELEF